MQTKNKNISEQLDTKENTAQAGTTLAPLKNNTKQLKTVVQRKYSEHEEKSHENEQIIQFLPMVHKVVQRAVTYLKPPLTYDDLVSAGTVGLVKAARDYDPSQKAEFKTYAYIRIRGAILDEFRGWSFVSAGVDKQIRQTLQISMEITEQTGAVPTDEQLAEKLDITIEQLSKIFKNARAKNFLSIDASQGDLPTLGSSLAATNTAMPEQQLEQNELIDKLTEAIQELSKRQRQVILLYYQQELTMKQAAEVLGITEPRVSQLHASALFNLSIKLRQWKNGK